MAWNTDFFEEFLTSLVGQKAWKKYDHRTPWTEAATRALAKAAWTLPHAAHDLRVAARHLIDDPKRNDPWGRREYFTVDVTGYDYASPSPPVLVAEHENDPSITRIRYTTWKLLAIRSNFRVLVGYYRSATTRATDAIKGKDHFFQVVDAVRDGSGVKEPLLAIAGDWEASANGPDGLRSLFSAKLVGARGQ
jgi:hypothetical protein